MEITIGARWPREVGRNSHLAVQKYEFGNRVRVGAFGRMPDPAKSGAAALIFILCGQVPRLS
jgi:hypothetical protein